MGNKKSVEENKQPAADEGKPTARKPYGIDEHDRTNGLPKVVEMCKTGDLVLMYETDSGQPSFGVLIKPIDIKPSTPLLIAKVQLDSGEYRVILTSAFCEIGYGGYATVKHRSFKADSQLDYENAQQEAMALPSSDTAERLLIQFYAKLQPKEEELASSFDNLPLGEEQIITLPEEIHGPVKTKGVSILQKLTLNDVSDKPHKGVEEIMSELDSGDVVLMSGITTGGAIIRIFDKADFSHVAMVIKDPKISKPCIWEAAGNSGKLLDVDTGHVIHGLSLIPFDAKVLNGWCKPVAVRKLKVSESEREEINKKLLALRDEFRGTPYEKAKFDMIAASIDVFDKAGLLCNKEEALDSIFCSELVAMAYQRIGILPSSPSSSEYTPEDFASSRSLALQNCHLDEEIYVQY